MKLKLPVLCIAGTLLMGCVGGATQSVRSLIPGQLSADQPILAQIDKTYSPGALAIGAEQDRYRNQSLGLGLISHPEAEVYINQQLDRLKRASGIAGLPGQAYLFADTAFGAKASADGNIYIPFAVLRDIDSTDELAALLAHELAHTIRNHNSSDLFVQLQKRGMMAAAMLGTIKQGDAAQMRASDQKLLETAFTTFMVTDGFINPGWTRRQELEADRLGMDLLIAAGYNGDAMFTLLDKMAVWEELNSTEQNQRNGMIDQLLMVNDPELAKVPFGASINHLLDQSASKLGSVVSRLNQDHDAAEKRYDSLLAYVETHYPNAPSPAVETSNWRRVAQSRESQRIWEGLTLVGQSREAAMKGNAREAEALLSSAVNPHTTQQNFLRQSFYELRAAQRNERGMEQNLVLAMGGDYPSFQLHVARAQLAGGGDPASAKRLMATFERYGKPPTYYLPVVTLAEQSELKAEALLLYAECSAKYLGDGIACNAESAAANSDFSYSSLMKSFSRN